MQLVEFENNKVKLYSKDKAFIKLKQTYPNDFYNLMLYVYHVSDYNAYAIMSGYDENETHEYALDQAGLDASTFEMTPELIDAIKAYYKIRDTSAVKYLKELYRSLNNSIKVVKTLNSINDELLEQVELIKSKDVEDLKSKSAMLGTIVSNQKSLFDMAKDSENYIDKLQDLTKKASEQQVEVETAMGGYEVEDSMIPGR